MPLTSDLTVDASKFDRKLADEQTKQFNQKLINIWKSGPRWNEVSHIIDHDHFFPIQQSNRDQVGAAEYRKLRWEGKTPLPKPVVLPEGINGTIPSRDSGREIPYRVFKPANGVSNGIHLHIHGGGWVLQSEH